MEVWIRARFCLVYVVAGKLNRSVVLTAIPRALIYIVVCSRAGCARVPCARGIGPRRGGDRGYKICDKVPRDPRRSARDTPTAAGPSRSPATTRSGRASLADGLAGAAGIGPGAAGRPRRRPTPRSGPGREHERATDVDATTILRPGETRCPGSRGRRTRRLSQRRAGRRTERASGPDAEARCRGAGKPRRGEQPLLAARLWSARMLCWT